MSGSEFVEMFVGVGPEEYVLVQKGRSNWQSLKAAVLFYDEVDAIGAQRSMDRGSAELLNITLH